MESWYKSQRRICAKKEKDIFIVKNREKEGSRIFEGLVKDEIVG